MQADLAELHDRTKRAPVPARMNLLGLDREGFERWCGSLGEKRFRALQLMRWVHGRLACDPSAMTDLAKTFRQQIVERACIEAPAVVADRTASDGTRKWLFDVGAGNAIEAVFIPEVRRGTLSISSQAGCAVDCRFCSTGKQGFSRNLTTAEILGQVWTAGRLLREPGAIARLDADDRRAGVVAEAAGQGEGDDEPAIDAGSSRDVDEPLRAVSNVVFVGMGEPLLNYDALLPALRALLDEHGYGLSRRRVTVSTSGVVPMIDRLAADCPVALAVSLHAGNDALRDRLVPLNRKYPLRELLAACRRYLAVAPRDFVTFEYVMLRGVNDAPAQARELAALLSDVPCKLNLIPFNPFPASGLVRSTDAAIAAFAAVLSDAGIVTTVRRTRGDDIDAACGQLAGEVVDRTHRVERVQRVAVLRAGRPGREEGAE